MNEERFDMNNFETGVDWRVGNLKSMLSFL